MPLAGTSLSAAARGTMQRVTRLDCDLTQYADDLDTALAGVMLGAASLGLRGTPALIIGLCGSTCPAAKRPE